MEVSKLPEMACACKWTYHLGKLFLFYSSWVEPETGYIRIVQNLRFIVPIWDTVCDFDDDLMGSKGVATSLKWLLL